MDVHWSIFQSLEFLEFLTDKPLTPHRLSNAGKSFEVGEAIRKAGRRQYKKETGSAGQKT